MEFSLANFVAVFVDVAASIIRTDARFFFCQEAIIDPFRLQILGAYTPPLKIFLSRRTKEF